MHALGKRGLAARSQVLLSKWMKMCFHAHAQAGTVFTADTGRTIGGEGLWNPPEHS